LISVVVPVRDGAAVIGKCIESLLAMDYPQHRVELLVVDNGSTDGSADVARRYPVTVLEEPRRGPSAARNTGIAAARGQLIAFTDADCTVAAQWAQAVETAFEEPAVDAVLGFAHGHNENLFAELAQRRWESFWLTHSADGLQLKRRGIDTRNCAVRKAVLDRIGCFDPDLLECEDLELSTRLNAGGCGLRFVAAMEVWHRNPTELRQALEKSRRRMTAVLQITRKLPGGAASPHWPLAPSSFLGLAERDLRGPWRLLALAALRCVRAGVFALLRALLALGVRHRLTEKCYNLYYGLSYELAQLHEAARVREAS
jgi:glycosyltransferase involved in cell wall biosynthesis